MATTAAAQCGTDEQLDTVARLLAPGKGILAADESVATVGKRLASVGVANEESNRRALRELLFTTPALDEHISGVILHEETLFQSTSSGGSMVALLQAAGIVPGIKVDTGTVPLPGSPDELMTLGLDTLAARVAKYYAAGARFAKWRAVIKIGQSAALAGASLPSSAAVAAAATALAQYAAVCQAGGLVPIVEPEVLAEGDHSLERCANTTQQVLSATFAALLAHGVALEAVLLKPNMVTPGLAAPAAAPPVVASETLKVLQRTVPVAVPGVVFLSGGQSEAAATENLAAINAAATKKPWVLSFSYGRALQATALKRWGGSAANVVLAQEALAQRAQANGAAALAT